MGITAKVFTRADLVTPVVTVTDGILGGGWTDEDNEVGYGELRLAYDHPDIGAFVETRLVVVGDDAVGDEYAFEIRLTEVDRMQEDEEAGQIWVISGDGASLALGTSNVGGAVVFPGCGDHEAFQSGVRQFGWMDCCCFDHAAAGFAAPPPLDHVQSNPDPPWKSTSPDGWPDPSAHRIGCADPVQTVAGIDEVQRLSLGTSIDSGTYTASFEGDTTASISSPWSAANLQSALNAAIDGSVSVTGAGIDSDPYLITYDGGNVAERDVPLLVIDHSSLNHPPQTVTVNEEVTKGRPGTYASAAGCCYFYKTFTTAVEQDLVLFYNLSKIGEIWIDGVEVARQTSSVQSKRTQNVPINLPAGDHCITARVCKQSASGLSWLMATLAVAAFADDGSVSLGAVAVRTDSSWAVLSTAFGATPPGATIGAIYECLVNEAQALQTGTGNVPDLPGVTLGFDAVNDSGGVPWANEYVWGVRIGTGLLDVLQQLTQLDQSHWRMQHSPLLQVDIWQNRGTDLSGSVVYTEANRPGGILETLPTGRAPIATSLLVETQDGTAVAAQQAGLDAYGSRRIGVTIGTSPTFEGLAGFATRTLSDHAREVWNQPLRTWGPAGLRPYADFDIDDLITAPDEDGVARVYRVVGITVALDDSPEALTGLIFAVALQDLPL